MTPLKMLKDMVDGCLLLPQAMSIKNKGVLRVKETEQEEKEKHQHRSRSDDRLDFGFFSQETHHH